MLEALRLLNRRMRQLETAVRSGFSCGDSPAEVDRESAQRRAFVIADNKLALNAGWDRELAIKLQALTELDFDVP